MQGELHFDCEPFFVIKFSAIRFSAIRFSVIRCEETLQGVDMHSGGLETRWKFLTQKERNIALSWKHQFGNLQIPKGKKRGLRWSNDHWSFDNWMPYPHYHISVSFGQIPKDTERLEGVIAMIDTWSMAYSCLVCVVNCHFNSYRHRHYHHSFH